MTRAAGGWSLSDKPELERQTRQICAKCSGSSMSRRMSTGARKSLGLTWSADGQDALPTRGHEEPTLRVLARQACLKSGNSPTNTTRSSAWADSLNTVQLAYGLRTLATLKGQLRHGRFCESFTCAPTATSPEAKKVCILACCLNSSIMRACPLQVKCSTCCRQRCFTTKRSIGSIVEWRCLRLRTLVHA